MVEIADIKDRDSLKEWLEDRSREECIQIATRAALRVLPLFWEWSLTESAQKHRITALPVLRCLLISRLAGKGIDDTQADANVAAGAGADPSVVYEEIAHLAAIAAYTSARINLYAVDAAKEAVTAVNVAATAAGKEANIIGLTKIDCKALIDSEIKLEGLPLWHELENPLQSIWQAVKTEGAEQPGIWAYWVQWYEDILAGNTPNWPLEQSIALIDNEFWRDGPEAVAEEIKRLQEQDYLLNEGHALREEIEGLTTRLADAETRSHNKPPELVDAAEPMRREMTSIGEQIRDAETELEKRTPDMYRLRTIGLAIKASLLAISRYSGKIANVTIMAGAAAIGTGGGKLIWDHFLSGRLLEWVERLLQFVS